MAALQGGPRRGAARRASPTWTAARRSVERDTGDDREAQAREATAAGVVGAWLKAVAADLEAEIAAIDARDRAAWASTSAATDIVDAGPDRRRALRRAGRAHRPAPALRTASGATTSASWSSPSTRRRSTTSSAGCASATRTSGSSRSSAAWTRVERDLVKQAFNDPSHSVRILLATDAAAEGLNLQRTARYLLHFDCPWNPSKLEQRNGRLDRHGQARDVTVHHFVTDQDQDLAFLAHVIRKADEIREDLGSANELFDEAAHRRLVEGESAAACRLTSTGASLRRAAARRSTPTTRPTPAPRGARQAISSRPSPPRSTSTPARSGTRSKSAMAIRAGRPQLDCSATEHTCKVLNPGASRLERGHRRLAAAQLGRGSRGPVARLAFSPSHSWSRSPDASSSRPRPDVLLMHLSHPMLQRALSSLTRRRFPGTGEEVSRWTVRLGDVPTGAEALVLLSVEELAVNDLRETFHHWVRTLIFPIQKGRARRAARPSACCGPARTRDARRTPATTRGRATSSTMSRRT